MNPVVLSSKSSEWETPKSVFDLLNAEFRFQLDAAASKENSLCVKFFSQTEDSLKQKWSEFQTIWCNPPYGRMVGKFIIKGWEASQSGSTVVFFIPARTDTKWWHDFCSKGEVRFIKGRLKFGNRTNPDLNPAPFPSAIVIFGPRIIPATKYVVVRKTREQIFEELLAA